MKTIKDSLAKFPDEKENQLILVKKDSAGIPRPTGPHTVTIKDSKLVKGRDFNTKEERIDVKLILDESGEEKEYRFPLLNKDGKPHYLARQLEDIAEGTKVTMEALNQNGKTFIQVREPDKLAIIDVNDIPIIDESTYGKNQTSDDEINVEDIPF